jgi:hypothetical protein
MNRTPFITFTPRRSTISTLTTISVQPLTFRLAQSGMQVSCLYHVPCKVEHPLGNNGVGADCVEFKPVENPKVFNEAGSPAPSGAWEEVTEITSRVIRFYVVVCK